MSAIDMSIGRGFLPPVDPVCDLAAIYPPSASIVQLTEQIPELIRSQRIAERLYSLKSLPYFEPDKFEYAVLLRSYAVIVTIVHAYIIELSKNTNDKSLPITLPPKIAHWVEYAAHSIGRLPTQSYETYVLQNYRLINPHNGFTLENIEPLLTYTGTTGEAWFIKMHVYAEYRAAKWMKICENINQILRDQIKINIQQLTFDLHSLADDLHEFNSDYFFQMKKNLSANEFFNNIRPYIKTWEPGIIYTGSLKYGGNLMKWRGASGAQSSFVPALDYLLGIKIEQKQTMKDMLNYMPPEHRAFLHTLQDSPLRKLTLELDNFELRDAYNNVISACTEFRKKHYDLTVLPYLINNLIDTFSQETCNKIREKIQRPPPSHVVMFIRRLLVRFFANHQNIPQLIEYSKTNNPSQNTLNDLLKILNDERVKYDEESALANHSVEFEILIDTAVKQFKCLVSNTLGTGGEDFRYFLPKNCDDTKYSSL